eukprot:TRINITY_DN17008_c0_g1_i1.p1 TRINITY_DN17008_c0_g1~~TRINITY_DN17008_c0_g1_i1.p1  ORF type:complete len:396 (+),score=45.58 TRINITY_DN17008_c0_g1_i1:869-2056(+)
MITLQRLWAIYPFVVSLWVFFVGFGIQFIKDNDSESFWNSVAFSSSCFSMFCFSAVFFTPLKFQWFNSGITSFVLDTGWLSGYVTASRILVLLERYKMAWFLFLVFNNCSTFVAQSWVALSLNFLGIGSFHIWMATYFHKDTSWSWMIHSLLSNWWILCTLFFYQKKLFLLSFGYEFLAAGCLLGMLVTENTYNLKGIHITTAISGATFMLLCSSFPTISQGWIFLVASLGAYGWSCANLTKFDHDLFWWTYSFIPSFLLFVYRPFDNTFLFWLGSAGTIAIYTHLQVLEKPLVAAFYSLVISILGLVIQSKLIVMVGYIFVVISINMLAVKVFSSSLLFPFVLTFCGLALIYAGMIFDGRNDGVLHVISLDWLYVRRIDQWATILHDISVGCSS